MSFKWATSSSFVSIFNHFRDKPARSKLNWGLPARMAINEISAE
jgi:hypothetical protein